MFVSKRLLILPLGLLITLPGCSGSRLQHILAPNRDFMTLSELDEYDDDNHEPASSLASKDADKTSEDEDGGLFNVAGWLRPKSKNNDALPPDPFLEDNFAPEADTKQPIATVGLSKNLEGKAEQLISDDATPRTAAPKLAAVAGKTAKRSSKTPTFADIMSEFEEAEEDNSSEPDSIDAMEQAWLENQSPESQMGRNFDTLVAEAIDDGSVETPSDGDEVTLNFDMLNEEDQIPYLNLAKTTQESEKVDELMQELEATESFDPFGDSSLELPNTADLFDSTASDDKNLWQSSDSDIGWTAPDSDDSAAHHKSPLPSDQSTMGNWDFGPAGESAGFPLQLPAIAQSSAANSNPKQRSAINESFAGNNSQSLAMLQSPSETLSNDSFLNDFATQAAAPANATGSDIPAVPSVGAIQNAAARTWLMLLGAVAIAYLLFAPEQKNLRHENNR